MRIPGQFTSELGATGVAPEELLPLVLTVDDTDSPRDVVDALALTPFAAGRQPYATTTRLSNVRADADLVPADARILREAVHDKELARLSAGDGWTLRTVRWLKSKSAELTVTAISAQLATAVMTDATRGAVEDPPPPDEAVSIGFWHMSGHGPRRNPRPITAGPWAEIRGNYASTAAVELDRLMRVDRATVNGRLLLLHGPPGTGKTTVLRSLARQWRDWCQLDCVLDPERLFADPAYLMDVALDDSTDCECDDQRHQRWRLLLLEDCDELIRGEAKQATGQALSRLLNLTDGLLGQGRDVLVAITTNEDLAHLHPAVTRPGRCLASVEVPALPFTEAAAWLGTSAGVPTDGATLAELYGLRDGTGPARDRTPVLSGQYL